MKILIVIPYFYPKIGGLENYALQIAKGLKHMRHEVIIVTTNHIKKEYLQETIDNLIVYRLPISFTISNTPINLQWLLSIDEIISKEQPDIINAHTPVPFISDIAGILAKKYSLPFVLTYQNDLIKDNLLLQFAIKLYYLLLGIPTLKRTDRIIASSQYYADTSSYLQNFKNKIAIVSPGVDIKRFSQKKLDKKKLYKLSQKFYNKKIILFIGQLDKTHEHKGLSYLIQALSLIKMKNEKAQLVVVGKGDNMEYYKTLTWTNNVAENVLFTGFVSDQDLPYFYNIADVIVLPSYNKAEGFGMVLIEAGASEKPVVASKIGGIPFVVKHNTTGLLTKPKDIKDLANAIITISTNEKLAQEMGEANFHWVKENFTWDKQIQKTEQMFKQLVNEKTMS